MGVVVEVFCDRCSYPVWRGRYESFAHAVRYAPEDASYAAWADATVAGGMEGRPVTCSGCREGV